MRHVVEVTKASLTQIILNGFEAFIIKHGNNKRSGIEFHASLYGDIHFSDDGLTLHHVIEFISADTSAEMTGGFVEYKPEASSLKDDLSHQLGFYQLGMMHSHPYLSYEMKLDEVRLRGFNFSKYDLKVFSEEIDKYKEGTGYHLEVLFTIKQMERANTVTDGRKGQNVFEFSVGNCKCFLRAQVLSKDENANLQFDDTDLICEFLERNSHLEAEFGRIKPKEGRIRVLEYKLR